jgi:lysozyme
MSHYQGRIFWHEVAAMRDKGRQISFVFIKATEGVAGRDKHFERNAAGATDEGLAAGAYHYFHPAQSAEAQAQNYLQTVRATGLQLRPALDIEVTEDVPPEALRDSICRWLAIVGQAYGEAPILYTGAAFYNTNLKGYFDDFPLWIAHYGVQKPGTQVDFQCWQFSDAGRVNGIGAAVDFNVVNGGPAALNRLLGRAGKFP